MITIIAIGKNHEGWVKPGVERYQKRLRPPFNLKWHLIPHSSLNGSQARSEESARIMSRMTQYDWVLLLDESGVAWSSRQLSVALDHQFTASRNVVIIIGGAYGVDHALQQRADVMVSLSAMVFPHQLVRLLLTEQLYRAQQIARGSNYHHA